MLYVNNIWDSLANYRFSSTEAYPTRNVMITKRDMIVYSRLCEEVGFEIVT